MDNAKPKATAPRKPPYDITTWSVFSFCELDSDSLRQRKWLPLKIEKIVYFETECNFENLQTYGTEICAEKNDPKHEGPIPVLNIFLNCGNPKKDENFSFRRSTQHFDYLCIAKLSLIFEKYFALRNSSGWCRKM